MVALLNVVMNAVLGKAEPADKYPVEDGWIVKIITRYPNLEVGFLAALLTIRTVRENLKVIPSVAWEFVHSSVPLDDVKRQIQEQQGWRCFNWGGGPWDQHDDNDENERCSLDLVRVYYDFLKRRKYLLDIYERVRQNDLKGTRISDAQDHLRLLMSALTPVLTDEEMKTFLCIGFQAIFARAKAEYKRLDAGEIEAVDVDALFSLAEMLKGLEEVAPKQIPWFKSMAEKALKLKETADIVATVAIQNAIYWGDTLEIIHPQLPIITDHGGKVPGLLKAVFLETNSNRAGQNARHRKFDVTVVWRPPKFSKDRGNVQIFTRDIHEFADGTVEAEAELDIPAEILESGDEEAIVKAQDEALKKLQKAARIKVAVYRLDLGAIAAALRKLEAEAYGKKLTPCPINDRVREVKSEVIALRRLMRAPTKRQQSENRQEALCAIMDAFPEKFAAIEAEIAAKRWEADTEQIVAGIKAAYAELTRLAAKTWWSDQTEQTIGAILKSLDDLVWELNSVYWEKVGHVYDEDGEQVPWFLADFWSLIANGTETFPAPPTLLDRETIFEIVRKYLPFCRWLKAPVDASGAVGNFVHAAFGHADDVYEE